jgi:hypothetical protein
MQARSASGERRRRFAALLAALLVAALPAGTAAAADEAIAGRWNGVERVVAIADVHGAYTELTGLLQSVGIVDAQLRWTAGATHLVMTGDLLDRGRDSRAVLELLMRLQQEATAAQGRLHLTLGNHEAMNLLGDTRYVLPDEFAAYLPDEPPGLREAQRAQWLQRRGAAADVEFDQRFPPGYFGHAAAFAPEGRYGRWLLAQPVVIAIDDTLFMHGGPSTVLAGMSLAEINTRYRTALVEYLGALRAAEAAGLIEPGDEYAARPQLARQRLETLPADDPARASGAAVLERFVAADRNPLIDPDGPNWYRGAALCHEASEADVLQPFLAAHAARRLVLGHTVARNSTVASRFDGAVIKLDAGMNAAVYRGRAAALLIERGARRVAYPGVEPAAVPAEPLHVASGSLADSVATRLLAEGAVTVTGPRAPDLLDVQVEHEGRRAAAAFLVLPEAARKRELAALRLDRALRLGLVPATVEREVQGQQGLLQLRPTRWVSQADVQTRSLRPGGWCALPAQFELMYAFDALVGNEARTPDRMLYDEADWMLLLTGHQRSFGTGSGLPAHLKARPPRPGSEMRRRLAGLDAAQLQSLLGDLLSERELRALLARRDGLLAGQGPAAAPGGDPR